MTTQSLLILLAQICITFLVAIMRPEFLSGQNKYLEAFYLNIFPTTLGVILAITLGSIVNFSSYIKTLEDKYGEDCFKGTRLELKSSAAWLIWLYIIGFILCYFFGINVNETNISALIMASILTVFTIFLLILYDVTMSLLDIGSH